MQLRDSSLTLFVAVVLAGCSVAPPGSASPTPLPARSAAPLGSLLRTLAFSARPALGFVDQIGTARADGGIRPGTAFSPLSTVVVRGWCVDPATHRPAGGLVLFVNGKARDVSAAYGLPRIDVATTYQDPDLLDAGYRIEIDARTLPVGRVRFELGAVSSDRARLYRIAAPALVSVAASTATASRDVPRLRR